MAERVTLLDVARRCKVSKATVSRVLNDPGGTISFRPRTRKRIQQAAQKLGYRPNHRAQALARNRSEAVGILYFSEMPPQGHQFEDFFKAFLAQTSICSSLSPNFLADFIKTETI